MEYTVGAEGARKRLDTWLASALSITRTDAQRLILDSEVKVEGRIATSKAMRLNGGEKIEIVRQPRPESAREPAPYEVRYEDAHLAVVYKPAGVVVHPAPGIRSESLVEALARQMPLAPAAGEGRPGVVHRLDKGTSGLLIVAKTDAAYRTLIQMMRERRIERTYLALVDGQFRMPTGRIEAPVGRRAGGVRMGVIDSGKDASTSFVVVEEVGDQSLIRVKLQTGRTHQIRVHFSHISHPVMGDADYGRSTMSRAKHIGLERPFLHAERLKFDHPIEGPNIDVAEALPEDLQYALDQLRDGVGS